MIAVVEIGGKQYTVEVGMSFLVDHQHSDVGATIEFSPLLVASPDATNVRVGTPVVEGAKVICSVDEHVKAEKVRVFKIKSKKRYNRTQGFRAHQTRLTVTSIA